MDEPGYSTIPELGAALKWHEERSQERYEHLMDKVDGYGEGRDMSDGINTDKVIVNAGSGGGDGSGLNAAVTMAALGNRNQGNDNAALVAALMNGRAAGPGFGGDGFGMGLGGGGGLLGGLLFGALLGGRRGGGLFGGDGGGDCGGGSAENRIQDNADTLAILQSIGSAKDATVSGFGTTALALSQGFANTKDAVQALALFQTGQLNNINQNVSDQGCKTREAVAASETAVLERISRFEIDSLRHERDRFERQTEINALRSQVEITNTNTATNAQAQGQFQTQLQFQDLNRKFDQMCGLVQVIGNQVVASRQAQDIVNLGTMVASGGQQATSTAVK